MNILLLNSSTKRFKVVLLNDQENGFISQSTEIIFRLMLGFQLGFLVKIYMTEIITMV